MRKKIEHIVTQTTSQHPYTDLDMFKKTRQAKAPTKQKSAGNSKQRSNAKAPTKKAIKNRKRPASESGDDTSDEEPNKRHPRKKTKHGRHEADEDIEEEDDDSEEPEEVVVVDDDEASATEKVSCWTVVDEVKLTHPTGKGTKRSRGEASGRDSWYLNCKERYDKRFAYHILWPRYCQLQESWQNQTTERTMVPSLQVSMIQRDGKT